MINESPQDKIIRELKEENSKLKQILKKLAAAGAGGDTINLAELGLNNIQDVVEDMEVNEKIMEDMNKPWEEKLAEAKANDEAAAAAKPNAMPTSEPATNLSQNDTMEESKVDVSHSSGQSSAREENTSADLFNNSQNSGKAATGATL